MIKDKNPSFYTESRTWRFFIEDVDYCLRTGMTPKSIFRLGCIAHRENPQLIARIRELELGNEKLQKKLTIINTQLNERLYS